MHAPVLLIHGGAGRRNPDARRDQQGAALKRVAEDVHARLVAGWSALDAAVEAVRQLEDDPLFNAGTGGELQADGVARCSAAVMDGTRRRFGGVVNVVGLKNPVRLARVLLEEDDRTLQGDGALARARDLGHAEADTTTEGALARFAQRRDNKHGTVGAVACDSQGRLAAATSTGGRGMERPGRVSDSCTAAGNYASPFAAVSATGIGEQIVEAGLAVRVVAAVEAGKTAQEAVDAAVALLRAEGWEAGLIAVTAEGEVATGFSTDQMSWHLVRAGQSVSYLDP